MKVNRVLALDGLRGLFCMMVVFFHCSETIMPNFLYDNFIVRSSDLFVDFFFVLSGFVIFLNYQNIVSIKQFKIFILKRFFRLYPLLSFSVLIFFLAEIISLNYLKELVNNTESFSSHLHNLLESLTFMNSTPIFGTSMGMNYPSWSISAEMISYLFFAALMLYTDKRNTIFSSCTIIISSTLFLFFSNGYLNTFLGDFGFIRGLLNFFSGVLVCNIYLNLKIRFKSYHEIICLACIGFLLYLMNYKLVFAEISIILIPLAFSFCLFIFSKSNGFFVQLLKGKLLQFLGKISFSIYLNHALVILVVPKIMLGFCLDNKLIIHQIIILSVSIVFLVIYSYFTYLFIEVGIGNFLKKKFIKKQSTKIF